MIDKDFKKIYFHFSIQRYFLIHQCQALPIKYTSDMLNENFQYYSITKIFQESNKKIKEYCFPIE